MSLTARLHGVRDLRVREEDPPAEAPPGWSRIAITSVGVCGSDLHWFEDGGIGEHTITSPLIPGHEFAAVALDGPFTGRRVAVDPAITCERCEQCRSGNGNLCPTVRFAGHGVLDGAMQEGLSWPDRLLVPLPDSLSDDAGALLEPLGVAIHAVGLSHVRLGDDVLVVGAGPLGVLSAEVALHSGAGRVFVSDPLTHRRETALRHGAVRAWAPDQVVDGIAEATSGRGVDVVLEMAGTDDAVTAAVLCARPGARVALAGIPSGPRASFPVTEARGRGLSFVMVRRMHETYPRAIALATSGVDLDDLVSARFPLADAADAFAVAADRAGDKTVIVVSEAQATR